MNKNTTASFAKGAITGMFAGAALLTVGKMVMGRGSRNLSKGSTKAVKAVGEFVDGIHTMFR